MSASKAEQVLEGIRASLETIPDAVVERNSVLPEKIPDGGLEPVWDWLQSFENYWIEG